jgi:diketogulonate reductase-like aldo/keto reductase
MSIPIHTSSNGFSIPKIGFGTWLMGRRAEYGPTERDEIEIHAIRQAVEQGMIHVDTAELYGNGYVEEMVAKALSGISRNQYFLTSKVKGQNATYDGIHKAVRNSLKRLQTDYLDLYLIHYREPSLDLEEGMRAMNELVDLGLVKHIGVSNFAPETLAKAQTYSKHPIVCDQVYYSLQHREAEKNGLVKYCQANDILLVAWGPVRHVDENTPNIPVIKEMMDKYGKTAAQISINWLTSQKDAATLVKTTNLDHLKENMDAASFVMDTEDIEKLRTNFPNQVFEFPGFPMR